LVHPGDAVYFKASWLDDFDPQLTAAATFHGEHGDTQVSMMDYAGEAQYAMVGGYQAVARRFLSPSVQMLLILPPEGESTSTFNVARLTEIRTALMPYPVDLRLPKWEFESANALKQPLRKLGMNAPFDPGADFSGITGMGGISINEIYHNAFVTVDEHGAEAAAATAAVTADAAGGLEQISATFDRPFIFLIYDEPTAQILFLGRVSDI
jgi:serpin B